MKKQNNGEPLSSFSEKPMDMLFHFGSSYLIGVTLLFGVVMALCSSMDLSVQRGILYAAVLMAPLISVCGTVLLTLYRQSGDRRMKIAGSTFLMLPPGMLLIRLLWESFSLQDGAIYRSLIQTVGGIFLRLSLAWPALEAWIPEGYVWQEGGCTVFFLLLTVCLSSFLLWRLWRMDLVAVTAVAISFLGLTMIVVDFSPNPWPFLSVCLALVLAWTTWNQRMHQTVIGGKFLLLSLPIWLAVFGLLFWFDSPESYVRSPWVDHCKDALQYLLVRPASEPGDDPGPGSEETPLIDPVISGESILLSRVGPNRTPDRSVLRLFYQGENGVIYLRGATYDSYDGVSWTQNGWRDNEEEATNDRAALLQDFLLQRLCHLTPAPQEFSLRVETASPQRVLYMPYGAMPKNFEHGSFNGSFVKNTKRLTQYQVFYLSPYLLSDAVKDLSDEMYQTYWDLYQEAEKEALQYGMELPDVTKQLLQKDVAQMLEAGEDTLTDAQIAKRIVQYVQERLTYDLNAPAYDGGDGLDDYVAWLISGDKRGYCLHFASATAVLLRCCDIPSRLVVGYLCNVRKGCWSGVSARQAHAWVEYYQDDIGWVPLEATPASALEDQSGVWQMGIGFYDDSTLSSETTSPSDPPETLPSDSSDLDHSLESEVSGCETENGGGFLPGNMGKNIPDGFGWFLLLPIFVVSLFLLRKAVSVGRRRLFMRGGLIRVGDANQRGVFIYRYLVRASHFARLTFANRLTELGEKARFSAHQLNEAELAQLRTAADVAASAVGRLPILRRLIGKYLLLL